MPIREIYERQEDGSVILVSTEEYDAPDLSLEIQTKEQQLLDLYEELKQLKEKQQ